MNQTADDNVTEEEGEAENAAAGTVAGPRARPLYLEPLPVPALAGGHDGGMAQDRTGRAVSTTTTFLALYLILLAFFIMLNAEAVISNDRTRAVVEGLGLVLPVTVVEIRRPMTIVAAELEERLAEVFRREVDRLGAVIFVRDGAIEITLPLDRVFEPGTAVLRTFRLSLVGRVAEILQDSRTRDALRLSLSVPATSGETTGAVQADDLAVRRAAALARDLVRQGVDPVDFDVRVADDQPTPGADPVVRFRLDPAGEG